MTFDILMPELNAKPKNTKDAVISILTHDWPLTLRQIFYKIKKQYHYSSTYQSVYKAVKELREKQVLIEKDKKYEINIRWIKKVQSFTDIVETNYFAKEKIQNFSGVKETKQGEDIIILHFETLFDAEKYLYYFIKNELVKSRNQIICEQINNQWKPLFYYRAEYNFYKKMQQKGHKFYFLCHGKSAPEKQSKEFYSSIGINVKNIENPFPAETITFNNYFIQVFIPEEIKSSLKKYLKSNDRLALLEKALDKKSKIKIIINRDKDLVEEVKKQIISQF